MHLKVGDPGADKYRAYLNGKLLEKCFEADEEEGYALCYARDEGGNVIVEEVDGEKQLRVERLEGKVELRLIK